VTTPVGVSGAVFLLPVQLSVLHVPQPRLTPTNLVYNVVSGPAAVLRHRRSGRVDRDLVVQVVSGAVPGVVAGAVLRVLVVADADVFRLVAAAVLAPTGLLVLRGRPGGAGPAADERRLRPRTVRALALVVGVAGGLYGVGGGSLLGPLLIAAGMSVATVAPAALVATWVTSVAGVAAYALLGLGLATEVPVSPDWSLGVAAGVGGLAGGWLGASLAPAVPERALRRLLGVLALGLAALYAVQAAGGLG
jgi:uncharacterized protein